MTDTFAKNQATTAADVNFQRFSTPYPEVA